MNFEYEIFKRAKINKEKLKEYGFVQNGDVYKFSKFIFDNFEIIVYIDKNGQIKGQVWDKNFDEEYTLFRAESQNGEFVNCVRDEFVSLLKDIKTRCFEEFHFITDQANRLTNEIFLRYGDEPEFLWEDDEGAGVFRNKTSNKWYGIIMNVNKSKLDKNSTEEIEVLNLKLNPNEILELLKQEGFYPAYHMNKKYWISIVLDQDLSDEKIFSLIEKSWNNTKK